MPDIRADDLQHLRELVAELEGRVEHSKRAAQRLAARDATTRCLSEAASLETAAPGILRAICETLEWQVGALWVVEPHIDTLSCVEVWHAGNVLVPEFERVTRESRFSRGVGLPGRVWASARPLWIPDVKDIGENNSFPRRVIAAKEGLVAALGFPIAVAGEVNGVMEFFSHNIKQPDEELLQMLGALGSQIGQFAERKRAEEMLDGFFTLSIDMLCIATYDGYYKRMNPAWERTLGYSVEELSASPYLEFVHPEDRDATIVEMKKLAAGQLTISFENRYRAKDGSYKWLLWTAAPYAQQRLIYAAARDITERKRAEENIRGLQGEAEAANRAKTVFLARMSHEIRTPLNVVIGMGDLLERTALNTEQRQYVRVFQRAGGNLLALINDVLDLAKVESGRIVLEEIDFEIAQVMESIVEMMSLRAKEKGIELSYEVKPETPARLLGDPDRLRQVLINLVSNAIKFTPKGQVAMRVERDPDSATEGALRFSVSDTGIGIPPEKLGSIFEAFTQADVSTTRKYGGTGLGLAISSRLVELMNGRIWAEPRQGAGTIFYFTAKYAVPPDAMRAVPAAPQALAAPSATGFASGLRILVADDSDENRFLVAEYLKDLGCRLEFAENGLITVEKFCSGTYDLVLMDLQMPVMDGYAATRRIRGWEEEQNRPPTAIVALTASALETELQHALDAGCTAWLRKPVRLMTLLDAVAKYTAKPGSPGLAAERIFVHADPRIRGAIPGYLDNRRKDVRAIRAALERSDYETIRELGHKMSGTGGGYGFPRITEIGTAIERAAKAKNGAEIQPWTEQLSKYIEQVEVL